MLAANPAWDPNYHGSGMFVPVVFSAWLLAVLFGTCLGEQPYSCKACLLGIQVHVTLTCCNMQQSFIDVADLQHFDLTDLRP